MCILLSQVLSTLTCLRSNINIAWHKEILRVKHSKKSSEVKVFDEFWLKDNLTKPDLNLQKFHGETESKLPKIHFNLE